MRNWGSVLAFTVAIACQFVAAACSKSQTVDLIQGATLLPNHPLTLRAPKPLQVVGSTNHLCLRITPPNQLNRWEWGVRRPDGVLVKFGATLLHADNSSDTISAVGYTMSPDDNCLTIGPSIHD